MKAGEKKRALKMGRKVLFKGRNCTNLIPSVMEMMNAERKVKKARAPKF